MFSSTLMQMHILFTYVVLCVKYCIDALIHSKIIEIN